VGGLLYFARVDWVKDKLGNEMWQRLPWLRDALSDVREISQDRAELLMACSLRHCKYQKTCFSSLAASS
jgi:hypothetical protein